MCNTILPHYCFSLDKIVKIWNYKAKLINGLEYFSCLYTKSLELVNYVYAQEFPVFFKTVVLLVNAFVFIR